MKRFTRIIAIMVLTVVVSTNLILVLPKPAQAQFVVSVPSLEGMSIREWIVDELTNLLKTVLFQGLMNALTYFTQKLAYDAAVWLASGGKGQGALFETKNWGEYMEDVALDTAGEFIGTLSEEEGWPIDLCQPTATDVTGMLGDAAEELTPRVTANLQLGLADTYEPRPSCEWNQIASNWDEFLSSDTSDQILAQFTSSMRPGEDGLGSALSLFEKVSSESSKKEEAAVQSRQEGKGVKSVETKVSGNVETPSYLVGEQFKQKTIDEPAKGQEQSVSGSLSISDSVLSMGANIGSMFLNTLTSKLFGNLMGGFFDAGELVSEKQSLWNLGGASTEPEGGRIAAEKIFADLLKPTFLEITNWNPLVEYSTCPPERGTNNCVIDSSLAAALTEGAAGNPISVREAMEKGYLRKDWPLIPLMDRSRSQDPNCFNYGYCAVNLSKLRKARIIPVGWEIAANLAENNPSSPITLGEVIARFNDSSPSNPYYHLIDPNWVLKMPATQCKMKVNGPNLVTSEGDMRESVCVDTPSCLAEGSDGKCLGAWGYCTREKNVWRIKADSCPAEFSSCESLTTRDKKKVAYLSNTMDYGGCNADNVGCLWYSTEKTPGASWAGDKRIYLNKNAAECKPAAIGCSDLIRKGSGVGANLLNNSSFESGTAAPDGWVSVVSGGATTIYQTDGGNSFQGSDAVRIVRGTVNSSYEQNLGVLSAGTYVISAYVKKESGSATGVDLALQSISSTSLNISLADSRNIGCALVGTGVRVQNMPGATYGRISCVFNLNSSGSAKVVLNTWGGTDGIFVDAVQLEEGVYATEYRETGYPWNAEHVTMKIPPAYLGCTGGTSDNPECANYAQVCAAENIGCNLFTPTNGEPAVSAKVSLEDACPAECAGYALFRQESTNFERANPAVYLIPKGAKLCSSDSAGCAEFTDTATGATSYYSFLRRCGTEGGATFYTWEGSDTTGYQIKSWSLLPEGSGGNKPPAYQPGFTDYTACTAAIFRSGTNPDCREFYDEAGNISYRLYSQTVVITPECKSLRKTLASGSITEQQSDCIASGGTWPEVEGDINQSNGCLYNGYGAESTVCGKEQNGCRAYGGNASRNVYVAFEETFESGSITEWEQTGRVSLSTESMQVGGHSLKAENATYVRRKFENLHESGIYNLSFWAKGPAGGRLEVLFEATGGISPHPRPGGLGGGTTTQTAFSPVDNSKVALATEWRLYNLGPVYFNRAPSANDYLAFYALNAIGGRTAMNNVYFDNIVLREVNQNIYLIKNSWTTPASCDRTINGESLPQAMVGCQEYKDPQKNLRYLKSFGSLCAENAAGCEAFIDTKNNETTFEETYNAKCMFSQKVTNDAGANCYSGESLATRAVACHIRKGERSCYFKTNLPVSEVCPPEDPAPMAIWLFAKTCRDKSTYTVPKDETLYLVNDSKKYCASEDVGCMKVGKPALTRSLNNEEDEASGAKYDDKVLKIRPSFFNAILCKENELWCEEFKRESGGVIYAKNPGERLCEYKENVLVVGVETEGWFKKDTESPCYDNSKEIAKNADDNYDSWVGVCEKKYSGCTTLTDPSDISEDYPQGKAYYVIRNEELDEKSCKGKVSKAEGCVLFKDLNDPTANYRADSTYLRSRDEASGGSVTAVNCPADETYCQRRCNWSQQTGYFTVWGHGLSHACKTDSDCQDVNPTNLERDPDNYPEAPRGTFSVSCAATTSAGNLQNDSNLIIKVTPDRECGEWLDCRSTTTVWDEAGEKYKKICTSVDLCREFRVTGENESKCVRYVEGDMDDRILNASNYNSRDTGWSGMEYSGYSIPNKYQIDDLEAVTVALNDKRLVKVLTNSGCRADGSSCGAIGALGKCYGGKCVTSLEGKRPTDVSSKSGKTAFVARTCRAYPEKTSPFPPTIAEWNKYLDEKTQGCLSVKKQGYTNASVCEQSAWLDGDLDNVVDLGERVYQNCECSYQKSTYGRGTLTKYFGYNQEFLPEGLCFGGPRDGLQCTPGVKDVCGPLDQGGTCERLTRADKYLGLEGYCVEYDYSKTINSTKDEYPCLTWRPVEIPEGGQDVYNQYQEAGYNPPSAGVGKYYCLAGKGNALDGLEYEDPVADKKISWNTFKDAINPIYSMPAPVFWGNSGSGKIDLQIDGVWQGMNVPDTEEHSTLTLFTSKRESTFSVYKEGIYGRQGGPSNKEDLAGIVLKIKYVDGIDNPDATNRDGYKIFSDDSGNILSRSGAHNGIFVNPKDGKTYSYWEARFPDIEDGGIKNWDSGHITYKTDRPLFVGPWYDPDKFTLGTYYRLKEEVDGCKGASEIKNVTNTDGSMINNYFAVRAMFDENDQFVGFWLAGCNKGIPNRIEEIVSFTVEFLKAEPCIYLAQVIGANGEQTARTNKIWQLSALSPTLDVGGKTTDASVQYGYSQAESPFGSAISGFKNPEITKDPWFVGREGNGSPYFTDAYFSQSVVNAGSVYSCRDGQRVSLYGQKVGSISILKINSREYQFGCFSNQMETSSEEQIEENLSYKIGSSLKNAFENLQQLFAKSYGIFAWNFNRESVGEKASYQLVSGTKEEYYQTWETDINTSFSVGGWDITNDTRIGKKVRIIAPNINGVKNSRGTLVPDANYYPFTINNQTNGLINGGSENFEVFIKFYGWADTDQMPIVSRWIEWGDGTVPANYSGKYKNHKPICATAPEVAVKECGENTAGDITTIGLTCETDDDCSTISYSRCKDVGLSFGNSPDACEEGYFEMSHTYICNEDVLLGLPVCPGIGEFNPDDVSCIADPQSCGTPCKLNLGGGRELCVFSPRVRITDNWGWCTAMNKVNCANTSFYSAEAFRGAIILSPSNLWSYTPVP